MSTLTVVLLGGWGHGEGKWERQRRGQNHVKPEGHMFFFSMAA